MAKLLGLLAAAVAIGVGLVLWRKNSRSRGSMWATTSDTASSWSKTAADEAGKAAHTVTATADGGSKAVSDLAEDIKGSVGG